MHIYDITIPMQKSLAPWPGDTPYDYRRILQREQGEVINLGTVTMSAHAGTHVDAPYHFLDDGATVEKLDLSAYVGPAIVLDVSGKASIRVEDLRDVDLSCAPRVLFRTNAWTDHSRFPETIPVMESSLPTYLRTQGVVLIGLDVPSVDALDSKELPIHHELASCGIHILESLYLAEVPEGLYELLALPMKLVGADGAPVRAILMDPYD